MQKTARRTLALLALLSITSLTGCTTRFVDYTLLSTKNVDLSKAGTFKRGPNRVTAEDGAVIIIFIPTGNPNLKEAVDKAIESVPGAVALVDGVVSTRNWWFLFGESAIIVEGTPLIDPAVPGASASLESERMVSFFNPKTRKQEVRNVNVATFEKVKDLAKNGNSRSLEQLLTSLQ